MQGRTARGLAVGRDSQRSRRRMRSGTRATMWQVTFVFSGFSGVQMLTRMPSAGGVRTDDTMVRHDPLHGKSPGIAVLFARPYRDRSPHKAGSHTTSHLRIRSHRATRRYVLTSSCLSYTLTALLEDFCRRFGRSWVPRPRTQQLEMHVRTGGGNVRKGHRPSPRRGPARRPGP